MKDEKDKKLKHEELHDTNQVVKPMLHEGHALKSRRDFLSQGFLGLSAFALAPSALSLISNAAHAQVTGCAAPALTGMTPVIIIDLAGGGNIAGSNVMVGGAGGQLDFLLPANYASLGLPPDFAPSLPGMVNSEMGLAFHSGSGMLRGIQSTAAVQTRANVEGTIFCTTSDDDTGNNQSNPMYWLNKAGAKGQIQQLAGTQQSDSGGNSQAPADSLNPSIQPVRVQSNQDAINLVSLGNRFAAYSPSQIDMILNTAGNMSGTKIGKIDRRSLPEKIKELLACGYSGAPEQIKNFSLDRVEPDRDTVATAVFNQITNQDIRNRAKPIAKLVIDGYIGAGTITLGGYDYHDGGRNSGNTRDYELGQLIGAIMELAARKQKDVVVYVLTDGGVSANQTIDNTAPSNGNPIGGGGTFGWAGDSGQRSATFMMVHKSGGRPAIRNNKRQVGYYKSNGAVEGGAGLTSNSVVNTSKAMVANYLALHGKEGDLESIIGDDPFKASLDKYLVFDKLR